jgi:hypothetical protein
MKLKIILAASTFFIATPLLIGQSLPSTELPTAPSVPNISGSSLPSIPNLSNASFSSPLPASVLSQSGLDTSTLSQNPAERARGLTDQYKQGLLDDSRLPTLPDNSSQLGTMAKRFAEQTFPQEFQAAKGLLSLPQSLPSAFPTSIPTALPTSIPTALPTSPTGLPTSIPTALPTSPTSLPTSIPTAFSTPSIPSF